MFSTVTSTQNPRIQALRALQTAKGREAAGCFLAEGAKLCAEALRDAEVALLLADAAKAEAFAPLLEAAPEALLAPAHVLASVCEVKTPQGVAAAVKMPPALDLAAAESPLLVLDGVQDPGNVGTMLRTAEAAGFKGALLSEACADPFAPKTVRASMGSVLRLPFARGDLPAMLAVLAGRGYTLVSAELGGQPFAQAARALQPPFALVIGSEGRGVSPAVSALCGLKVALPMRGRAESLNAAVAAGILMYGLAEETP
ncbi:MAG: RNA methyltransferase [Oscillospiraceae bacterium]|jgi:TrmH family RNA methyltransferase|nr:RNA methyltransferase [Oscillospiraceae bacterium]